MKKNGMKKVWVPVIALCSAGLLVGTGFAAWTITLNQKGETSGNRKADSVTDEHIIVKDITWEHNGTALGDGKNPTVCFGYPESKTSDGVKGSWMTNTYLDAGTNDFTEARSFTLKFNVETGANVTTDTPKVTRKIEDKKDAAESKGYFATCVEDNLISPPGTTNDNINYSLPVNQITTGAETHVASYSVDVTFKWGSHFSKDGTTNLNPLYFYNSFTTTSEWDAFYNVKDETAKKKYQASMYEDFSTSMNKIAKLHSNGTGKEATPRFDITIEVTKKA